MNDKLEDNKELATKLIDLMLTYSIKDSHIYLELLNKEAQFYQRRLITLETNKPFWFERKKMKEHNKEINKCESKLMTIYLKIGEEMDLIIKMNNSIRNANND